MGRYPANKPEPGNEAPALNEGEVPQIIKLAVPPDLYAEYEELAQKQGLTVAELMIHRLQRCKDHISVRPLYFTDAQRTRLEALIGKRPLDTTELALSAVSAAFKVRIDQFDPISLTVNQVRRIHMGAIGGQTPQDKLEFIITRAVSKETGI